VTSWPARTHALPDGRTLSARYAGEPTGWIVHLEGCADPPTTARDIYSALVILIAPGDGLWPDWFMEAASDLAAHDTPVGRRYVCPCCGYLTADEPPPGTFNICAICGWEDDNVQFHDPDFEGGANIVSLNQARRNYLDIGASDLKRRPHLRPPRPEERP
jgi:hypothetical protein